MAEIPLGARDGSVRAVALVDESDLADLSNYRWSLDPLNGYARRGKMVDGLHTHVKMHRQILGLERGDKRQGDHINGERLDNRRCNLRVVTAQENGLNRRSYANSTSQYRGVSWVASRRKWLARVKVNGKTLYFGAYDDELEAARVARAARIQHFGELAA